MEQLESYKDVETRIRILEQQLALCIEQTEKCAQSGNDAVKEIEIHFEKIVNAIADRKAALILEVSKKVTTQRILDKFQNITINH